MDFCRLDIYNYEPDVLVEDLTTKIWTERYHSGGDFEIQSPAIEKIMGLIPEGSLVSLMDSDEVMVVEDHVITKDDQGKAVLKTTGRALSTILEQRYLWGDYATPWQTPTELTVQDAISLAIDYAVIRNDSIDVTGGPKQHDGNDAVWNADGAQEIHYGTVQPKVTGDYSDLRTTQNWWFQNGEVAKQVSDMLAIGKLSLKTVRPTSDYVRIDVDDLGVIHKTPVIGSSKLQFCVYNGQDRTVDTPTTPYPDETGTIIPGTYLEPVIFRYDAGHIQSPNYLFSIQNWRNFCQVTSSLGDLRVWMDRYTGIWFWQDGPYGAVVVADGSGVVTIDSSLFRRAMLIDAGTLDSSITDFTTGMIQAAQAALKTAKRQQVMDGAISAHAPYVYGADYGLGDLVTIVGEYNIIQTMQVSEYIRTEDAENGERGYPTLVVPE